MQLSTGTLSPVELVKSCLDQIDKCESQVAAWELVDRDGALKEARRIEQRLRQRRSVGALAGIPIGIKDILDVAGWPTKAGSRLRTNHVAQRDAEVVRKLREADAIVLGKTVTTEFASFDPPRTANPWNTMRTPGGSSSGSAAAVATGMCLAALGTQTGGSVIRPASYCGVFGFKPSYGAISLRGVVPLSPRLDHVGIMARSADDLGPVLAHIAKSRRLARFHMEMQLYAAGAQSTSSKQASRPYRLLQLVGERLPVVELKVAGGVQAALQRLASDYSIETTTLPCDLAAIAVHHYRMMAVEAAHVHREAFEREPHQFGPRISELIETGLNTKAVDYVESLRYQKSAKQLVNAWLREQRVILLMPATTSVAPTRETTGNPAWNSPWSYLGLPSLTIPCGLVDGLPIGLQLVGAHDADQVVIAAAQAIAAQCAFLGDARPICVNGA